MTRIHPSAIVDSGAELADDVEIGAFTTIGPHVRIGTGSRIGAHCVIDGHTSVGSDNSFAPFCSIGGPPQDKKYRGEPTRLEIGDRNTVREYCYFNPGTVQDVGVTRIGHDNWIMGYVHIAHDCQIGDNTIFANSTQLAGHVHIGNWVVLGGLTGVHQFVKVGEHAMTGVHTSLLQDLPPYVMCSGVPASTFGINAEGLRRRGFDAECIATLRRAYKLVYRSNLTLEQARTALGELALEVPAAAPAIAPMAEFLDNTTRGIVR
jgi:UDP-N-acetylglucosamine acyltransferase